MNLAPASVLLLALVGSLAACHTHPAATTPPVAVITYTIHVAEDPDPARYPPRSHRAIRIRCRSGCPEK